MSREQKPLPKWLRWPWNVVIYAALVLALRIFSIPIILILVALRARYSPHGAAEGYCLARTRRRLVLAIPGVLLLAFGVFGLWACTAATREEWRELLLIGGLSAAALIAGIVLIAIGIRDACFPARSKLAKSIRSQLPHPDEAPDVNELFAMVDRDLAENGLWFGPVGVGKEWVLGSQANLLERVCGVFTIDRIRRRGGKSAREMSLVLIDDRWQLSCTHFTSGPDDLQAAADCIALRCPEARRGVNGQYQDMLHMDEADREQFLLERRRRQGERQAQAARQPQAVSQDMTLTCSDGSATSRVTPERIRQALDTCLAQEGDVFFLTPARPIQGEGMEFSELECRSWPMEERPAELLLKRASDRPGMPPEWGWLRAFTPEEAQSVLEDWIQRRPPCLEGWDPVGLRSQGQGPNIPARLRLETPQGLRQTHERFTQEDVAVAADGLVDGTYRFVEVLLPGGYLLMQAAAGDKADGRCTVTASRADPDQLRFFEIRCTHRQAAQWLCDFAAGRFQTDWKGWKDCTERMLPQ